MRNYYVYCSSYALTSYPRNSCHRFHVVGDGKVSEYSKFLVMTVAMLLRYIHAVATKTTSQYGPFEVRVTKSQLKASHALYHLFLMAKGDAIDPEADVAIHNLFEALVCAADSDDRAINYPTDQVLFLWAYLSDRMYRIPSHVQALLSTAKYCFRCIALQIARMQVEKDVHGPLLEAKTFQKQEIEPGGGDGMSQNGQDDSYKEHAPRATAADNIDIDEALQRLNEHLGAGLHGENGMLALNYCTTSTH